MHNTGHLQEQPFHEGARVGRMGLSPSLNPYRDGDPLNEQWRLGWQSGQSEHISNAKRRSA